MLERPEPSFVKSISITFAILTSSIPVVLIPLVNILAITMVPYISTAVGSRYSHPRDRLPMAITTSIIWSVLETAVLLSVMSSIPTPGGFYIGTIGTLVLVFIWACNITFSVLGAVHPWRDPYADLKG
ncbi:MAG: hypothetical protein ACMUIG_01170 [Thermoplasmatota archaeon]